MRAIAVLALVMGCAVSSAAHRPPPPQVEHHADGVPLHYWTAESPREAFWARPAVLCDGTIQPNWDGRFWKCGQ